jgi:hypothetical protein
MVKLYHYRRSRQADEAKQHCYSHSCDTLELVVQATVYDVRRDAEPGEPTGERAAEIKVTDHEQPARPFEQDHRCGHCLRAKKQN